MTLKTELKQIRKQAISKQKEKEREAVKRTIEEQKIIEEFIIKRLHYYAQCGDCYAEYDSKETIFPEDKPAIDIGVSDYKDFAKKHHLEITYMDDEHNEVPIKDCETVILAF